jgi:hypothetical protein
MTSAQAPAFKATWLAAPDIRSQLEAKIRYENLPQSTILRHCLHQPTIPFASTVAEASLRDAVIVGLDAEWYEHDNAFITELGISVLFPEVVDQIVGNWNSPWDVISRMMNYHVRIKCNSHMVNSELCEGHPDKFQFGETTFMPMPEARSLLQYAFSRYDSVGRPRPVVFVGHAVANDIRIIKHRLGFDIDALGLVVTTIDTQVMATENGLAEHPHKIGLAALMGKYGIKEPYLHNAGNDTVCTMIAAILMAYRVPVADNSSIYENLKLSYRSGYGNWVLAPVVAPFDGGTQLFCVKCESHKHVAADCFVIANCFWCAERPHLAAKANTHKARKCLEHIKDAARARQDAARARNEPVQDQTIATRYPTPCALCIASPDPERYSVEFAYGHLQKDCIFKTT